MLYKVTGAGHSVCVVCVCVWGGGGQRDRVQWWRGVREGRGARSGGSSASV